MKFACENYPCPNTVEEGDRCSKCHTYQPIRTTRRYDENTKPREGMDSSVLPVLVAVGVFFLVLGKGYEIVAAGIASGVTWFIANSKPGRMILKFVVILGAIGLITQIFDFSKTYR